MGVCMCTYISFSYIIIICTCYVKNKDTNLRTITMFGAILSRAEGNMNQSDDELKTPTPS